MAVFYETVLGLRRREEAPDFVLLASDDFELSIVAVPAAIAAGIEVSAPPVARDDTPIKLSYLVLGIETLRSVIADAGGVLNPRSAQWIWRSQLHLDGLDPEGNVFQLRELA